MAYFSFQLRGAASKCGSMSERQPFIEARGLEKSFGSQHILRGLHATVYKGETLVVLGPSGEGKSVLMKLLTGLLSPDAGEVLVDGKRIDNLDERELLTLRRRMGMMFQNGALFDSMTVGQNVAFPLRMNEVADEEEIYQRVEESLEIVRLSGQGDKMPSDLSGGMRKRVALARAVVSRPHCIFYDEPHAGLDPVTADKIDRLIKRLEGEHGITNIVVTHEMRSVFRIADRVLFIKGGVVYWEGTAAELQSVDDPFLRDFIDGNSGAPW